MEGKAEALIDARGNRVFGINLYSDLRPLFNEAGDKVKANVLTNTLVIRFNGGGMPRTETFSLDPSSLKDLKEQVIGRYGKTRRSQREAKLRMFAFWSSAPTAMKQGIASDHHLQGPQSVNLLLDPQGSTGLGGSVWSVGSRE